MCRPPADSSANGAPANGVVEREQVSAHSRQFARQLASGGVSGVCFSTPTPGRTRVSVGCRSVYRADRHLAIPPCSRVKDNHERMEEPMDTHERHEHPEPCATPEHPLDARLSGPHDALAMIQRQWGTSYHLRCQVCGGDIRYDTGDFRDEGYVYWHGWNVQHAEPGERVPFVIAHKLRCDPENVEGCRDSGDRWGMSVPLGGFLAAVLANAGMPLDELRDALEWMEATA
jgi:hypothetical protein